MIVTVGVKLAVWNTIMGATLSQIKTIMFLTIATHTLTGAMSARRKIGGAVS